MCPGCKRVCVGGLRIEHFVVVLTHQVTLFNPYWIEAIMYSWSAYSISWILPQVKKIKYAGIRKLNLFFKWQRIILIRVFGLSFKERVRRSVSLS